MELAINIIGLIVGIMVTVLGISFRSTNSPVIEKDREFRRATTFLIVAGAALICGAAIFIVRH